MEFISFEIPVMGTSYFMYVSKIKFSFQTKTLCFTNRHPDQPMVCSLYWKVPHHQQLVSFLEQQHPSPFLLLKPILKKHKYVLSIQKNVESFSLVVSILQQLFVESLPLYVSISLVNNNYMLSKCCFHLLDFYEMGYMSLLPVVVASSSFLNQYDNVSIFTGIFLSANRPFHKYSYDYVELNFTNMFHHQDVFLDLSFEMMLQDRPEFVSCLTRLLSHLLETLPFREKNKPLTHLKNWKQSHEVEIYHYELDKTDWKPSLFLKSFSRILDMFPFYNVHPKYNFCFSV